MKNYRGRIGITYEMLCSMLGLPEEVDVELQTEGDHARRIGYFYLRSNQQVKGLTFPAIESQYPPDAQINFADELVIKRMKEYVRRYEEMKGREIK